MLYVQLLQDFKHWLLANSLMIKAELQLKNLSTPALNSLCRWPNVSQAPNAPCKSYPCPLCSMLIMPQAHYTSLCPMLTMPYAYYAPHPMPIMLHANGSPCPICPMLIMSHVQYASCPLYPVPLMLHAHCAPCHYAPCKLCLVFIIPHAHQAQCPFFPMPILSHAHYFPWLLCHSIPHARYATACPMTIE